MYTIVRELEEARGFYFIDQISTNCRYKLDITNLLQIVSSYQKKNNTLVILPLYSNMEQDLLASRSDNQERNGCYYLSSAQ